MSTNTSTSDPAQQADTLRREMRGIRRELGNDVEELVENAERLMDWRYYVNRYPWVTVGAATLLGYFLVPRRIVTTHLDSHAFDEIAQRLGPALASNPQKKEAKPGWFSSLVSMGTGMVMRAAVGYATQHLSQYLNRLSNQPPGEHRPYAAETHHG